MQHRGQRHNKALCHKIHYAKKRRSITRPLILCLKDYDNYRLALTDTKPNNICAKYSNRGVRP